MKRILAAGVMGISSLLLLLALSNIDSGSAKSTTFVTVNKVIAHTSHHPANATLAAKVYRPQGKWCPTVHLCFGQINWHAYGNSFADGQARITACPPSASRNHCSAFPADISLYSTTSRCGQLEFNELKVKAKGETFVFGLDSECRLYTGNSGAFLGQQYAGFAYTQKIKIIACRIKIHHQQILTSAKGISCQDAADDLIAAELKPTFTTPLGFVCQPIEGSQYGAEYRCVRDEEAYRFKFGY